MTNSDELEKSVKKSLDEYNEGNYKTVHSTDELFKDLDN